MGPDGPDYIANRNSGSSHNSRSKYKYKLSAREMDGNESLSNVHSEPALAHKIVTFNEKGHCLTAHSSGDLTKHGDGTKSRKKGTKSKNSKKPLRTSPSPSVVESQKQGLQQNGVLRISAPFLNNPVAESVYNY